MKVYHRILRRRRLVVSACAGLWVLAAVATHVPASHLPGLTNDKLLHGLGYLGLGGMFWLMLRAYAVTGWGRVAWMLTAMPAYAALDEITQPMFRRAASLGDWAVDVAATVAALVVMEALDRLLAGRRTV